MPTCLTKLIIKRKGNYNDLIIRSGLVILQLTIASLIFASPHCCLSPFIFFISTLGCFRAKVLHVFKNHCLIAGLQKKKLLVD